MPGKILKVRPVKVEGYLKKKYIEIDGMILETEYAKTLYPEKIEEIDKAENILKPGKFKAIEYRTFPDNDTMLKKVLEERENTYKKLHLDKIVGEDADEAKAFLLFLHLTKRLSYNMTIMENRVRIKKHDSIFDVQIENALEKYFELKKAIKQETSAVKRLKLQKELHKVGAYNTEMQYRKINKEIHKENRDYLTALYNALIYNTGVCEDFSYAYDFLLAGQDIASLKAIIYSPVEEYSHAINFIGRTVNGEPSFYLVDVTQGVGEMRAGTGEFYSFGIPKSQYLPLDAEELIRATIQQQEDPNLKNIVLKDINKHKRILFQNVEPLKEELEEYPQEYLTQEEGQGVLKLTTEYDDQLDRAVSKAQRFIMNGYKEYGKELDNEFIEAWEEKQAKLNEQKISKKAKAKKEVSQEEIVQEELQA